MFAFSMNRGASSQISSRRSAVETRPGLVSEPPRRRRSPIVCPRTPLAEIGAVTGYIAISVLLAMLAAVSATAEDSHRGLSGPDEADLRYFFECSELANQRLLSLDEAYVCGRVFMNIKLSFVPDVGLDDFDALSPEERAAVNIVGYRRYMEWRFQNAAMFDALEPSPPFSSVFAED